MGYVNLDLDAEGSSRASSPSSSRGGREGLEHDMPSGLTESEAKRRKLRKGTHSCWECKKRKIRCTFGRDGHIACIACRRRGTACLSQEFPDGSEDGQSSSPLAACYRRIGQMGDRIVHIESLIEDLARRVSAQNPAAGTATPFTSLTASPGHSLTGRSPPEHLALDSADLGGLAASMRVYRDPQAHVTLKYEPQISSEFEKFSEVLYAAMPTPQDIEMLAKQNPDSYIHAYRESFTTSYHSMLSCERENVATSVLLDVPGPKDHPTLIARYMLTFACHLQTFLEIPQKAARVLLADPKELITRIMNTVTALVTSNDSFLGSVEGVECAMLQGLVEANDGDVRRAWLAFRRATVVGQLMGINKRPCPPLNILDRRTKVNPQHLWFRVVQHDRWISLLLGLPQGCLDFSMASEEEIAADTPMGRLERNNCVVAGRILQRNEQGAVGPGDWEATQAIDADLQSISRKLPSKWWLFPNLATISLDSPASFWELQRALAQLMHFYLVTQLYLPYMLRFAADEQSHYSMIMCASASREVLVRFVPFRSFTRLCGGGCRPLDFYALSSAMALLLAHIHSHQHRASLSENVFAHQRLSDRAILEQVVELMEAQGQHSKDSPSLQSASLLRRLMDIEEEASGGGQYKTYPLLQAGMEDEVPDDKSVLQLPIPYFGTVKIAKDIVVSQNGSQNAKNRERRASMAADKAPPPPAPFPDVEVLQSQHPGDSRQPEVAHQFIGQPDPEFSVRPGLNTVSVMHPRSSPAPQPPAMGDREQGPAFAPQYPAEASQLIHTTYQYPALTARAEDWAGQSVDVAFFSNIMRRVGDPSEVGGNHGDACGESWTHWQHP